MSLQLIHADWPAPDNITAFTTTRIGGVSNGAFDSLNLAAHVGDLPQHVERNRKLLRQHAKLPAEPVWLSQCHGNSVVQLPATGCPEADAAWTSASSVVCAVLTADCLPLLMCNRQGTQVAAVHAGWRGLHAGVISNTIRRFDCAPDQLLVWLGPAIGRQAFEVGQEVVTAFCDQHAGNATAFDQVDEHHWLCDLYRLARRQLQTLGVSAVYGGDLCTFSDSDRFYSYRRQGDCGRIASLIWQVQ